MKLRCRTCAQDGISITIACLADISYRCLLLSGEDKPGMWFLFRVIRQQQARYREHHASTRSIKRRTWAKGAKQRRSDILNFRAG